MNRRFLIYVVTIGLSALLLLLSARHGSWLLCLLGLGLAFALVALSFRPVIIERLSRRNPAISPDRIERIDFEPWFSIRPPSSLIQQLHKEVYKRRTAYLRVVDDNPRLALTGFRMELEDAVKKLSRTNGLATDRKNLGDIVQLLMSKKIISLKQHKALTALISVLNEATHDDVFVHDQVSAWLINNSSTLIDTIEALSLKKTEISSFRH